MTAGVLLIACLTSCGISAPKHGSNAALRRLVATVRLAIPEILPGTAVHIVEDGGKTECEDIVPAGEVFKSYFVNFSNAGGSQSEQAIFDRAARYFAARGYRVERRNAGTSIFFDSNKQPFELYIAELGDSTMLKFGGNTDCLAEP